MVSPVDAASALADLTEISPYVEAAAILDREGATVAATTDTPAADRLARAGQELLRVAGERLGAERREPTHVEAALRDGSVFAVRDGERSIVARTRSHAPSALVLHDLEACLRDA